MNLNQYYFSGITNFFQSQLLIQDNKGQIYGTVDFDIAHCADGLEELKDEEKLRKPISLNFSECEADPKARLDIIIQFKNVSKSPRQTTASRKSPNKEGSGKASIMNAIRESYRKKFEEIEGSIK